jgi:hypothetical protein
MMVLLGVILTALAVLFLLTTLALGLGGHVRHPRVVAAALIAVLIFGLLLLSE